MRQQTSANVPFTLDLDAPAATLRQAAGRACEVARHAIGPTARPTVIYQQEREGCLYVTAVFVAGDDTPHPWASDAAGPPLPGITITGWLPYQARSRFLARADELGVREVGG